MKTFTRILTFVVLCCCLSATSKAQTCLTLEMFDSFGDGWNGGVFQLYSFADNTLAGSLTFSDGFEATGEICVDDGCYYIQMIGGTFPGEISWTLTGSDEGSISGNANTNGEIVSVNSSCIPGCMDLLASNYNPAATLDDGTCLYCGAGEQVIRINLYDSFGDGWNGASFFIFDDMDNLVMSGTLTNGNEGTEIECLEAGCYIFSVTSGSFPGEVSWELADGVGNVLFDGGANESYGFSWAGQVGCIIPGCMDETCNNYNPFATEDNGSCVCPPANDQCTAAVAIGCGQVVDGTTVNANMDPNAGDECGGIPITEPGVWYTFIGTGDQVTLNTCASGGADTRISVFVGSCVSLACVAANDDACGLSSQITFTTINGLAYYVLISQWSTIPNTGNGVDFTLEMTCTDCDEVPINDNCATALPQPDNIPTPGNLCCANPDDISAWEPFSTGYGVWYTMNSGDYDTFDFTLINGNQQGPDAGDGTNVGMIIFVDNSGGCGELDFVAACPAVTNICAGDLAGIGVDIVPNTNYYFLVYTTDAEGCGNFTLTSNLAYLGCTDPNADNYDPLAELEDGSCTYTTPPVNDLCEDAIELDCNSGVLGTTGLSSDTNAPVGCTLADDDGVWYTFTGDGQLVTISTCGSAIDSRISVVSSANACNGPFTCIASVDNDFSAAGCPFPNNDDGVITFISEVGTTYYVYVSAGQVDTDGDFIADLFDGAFSLDFSCEPVVEGCTNACACNYNEMANVEDGSCEFFSCVVCTNGEAVMLDMTDSFGDGWNGATYEITDLDDNVIASGSIDDADCTESGGIGGGIATGFNVFCLEAGCYNMSVGGGTFDGEIGFTLIDEEGNTIVSGGAGTFSFTIGSGLCGCTDPVACNYNPLATSDDNSCEYATCSGCTDVTACNFNDDAIISDNTQCCYSNCVTFIMNDSFGDGWNGATATFTNAVTGSITATATLPAGSTGTVVLCLPSGCYNILVSNGLFPGEISWTLAGVNGGLLNGTANGPNGVYFSVGSGNCIVGCTEPLACNYNENAGISDCTLCEYQSCLGCTYENATNYDPAALIDDGSCIIEAASTCPADLDGNGVIGVSDLVIFIGAYGSICPN